MLIKYKEDIDKQLIEYKHYYILDDKLEDFIEGINKKGSVLNDLNNYVELFDVSGILLVIETKQKELVRRKQEYYRIYNGSDIFWGEIEDFERL